MRTLLRTHGFDAVSTPSHLKLSDEFMSFIGFSEGSAQADALYTNGSRHWFILTQMHPIVSSPEPEVHLPQSAFGPPAEGASARSGEGRRRKPLYRVRRILAYGSVRSFLTRESKTCFRLVVTRREVRQHRLNYSTVAWFVFLKENN